MSDEAVAASMIAVAASPWSLPVHPQGLAVVGVGMSLWRRFARESKIWPLPVRSEIIGETVVELLSLRWCYTDYDCCCYSIDQNHYMIDSGSDDGYHVHARPC